MSKAHDPVNSPRHYTMGGIEVLDFIQAWKLNFCRASAIKYIVRAGIKNKYKEIEDLEKAVFLIKREIKQVKKELKKDG